MTNQTNDSTGGGSSRWPLIIGALVIVAALIGALLLVTGGDDDGDSTATTAANSGATTSAQTTTPPTTESPATTEVTTTTPATTDAATTEPPTTDPNDAARQAIWPWVDSPTRFAEPVDAATSFATDYLGFTDPVVGAFQAGDNRSGEIEVKAGAVGPMTVVFVRQLTDDDSWWVLGAAGENLTIDEPSQGAIVDSPLAISGSAAAFEGTVDVELRADANGEPIYQGFVTGSGGPQPGPFSDVLEFTSPGPVGGALVLISRSPVDDHVVEASALRIFFG
jgi:hypothetical protein